MGMRQAREHQGTWPDPLTSSGNRPFRAWVPHSLSPDFSPFACAPFLPSEAPCSPWWNTTETEQGNVQAFALRTLANVNSIWRRNQVFGEGDSKISFWISWFGNWSYLELHIHIKLEFPRRLQSLHCCKKARSTWQGRQGTERLSTTYSNNFCKSYCLISTSTPSSIRPIHSCITIARFSAACKMSLWSVEAPSFPSGLKRSSSAQ